MKLPLSILLLILLSSCTMVEVEDYVHEETQQLRQSMIWNGNVRGIDDKDFILVPNFREFTSSFSSQRSSMIIVSKESLPVYFINATFINSDTGYSEELVFDESIGVDMLFNETGYYRGFLALLNSESYSNFSGASEIEVVIAYTVDNGQTQNETFVIKLVKRKESAWVT